MITNIPSFFSLDHAFEMSKLHLKLFVCLFGLRPMSTAMVMAGRSVDLTTLFLGQA